MIGSRFAQYEFTTLLGSGGMGEVYRARDTKLGRSVAIKVLPDAVATDPERIARFEREAVLLARSIILTSHRCTDSSRLTVVISW